MRNAAATVKQSLRHFYNRIQNSIKNIIQNGNSFRLRPEDFPAEAAALEAFLRLPFPDFPEAERARFSSAAAFRAAFLPAVASISLMRLSWLTSLAPGS